VTDHDQLAKDEKQILELLSKGLSKDFRNPSRLGCPDSTVLEGIASHRITLAEAEQLLDHLGSCSACFAEFTFLRKRLQTRRQIALGSTLAILLASAALWFTLHSRFTLVSDETAVLDFRGYSIERGRQPHSEQAQLGIDRSIRHLILYLPMGTEEGHYELALLKETGGERLRTTGIAQFEKHVVILRADIDLSSVQPDSYFLGVRLPGSEWVRFPVRVH
jgi:hypothetical protein